MLHKEGKTLIKCSLMFTTSFDKAHAWESSSLDRPYLLLDRIIIVTMIL